MKKLLLLATLCVFVFSIKSQQYPEMITVTSGTFNMLDEQILNLPDTVLLPFKDNAASFRIKNKWGFINEAGQVIVQAKYDSVGYFSEGVASFYVGKDRNEKGRLKGGQWGYLDKKGSEFIAPQFYEVKEFSQGIAAVETSRVPGTSGYINKKGQPITPMNKYIAFDFNSEGVAIVQAGIFGDYRLIDRSGKEILGSFIRLEQLGEGLYLSQKSYGLKFIVFDLKGNSLFDIGYPLKEYEEGLAVIKKQEKFGFIDKAGREAIPPSFLAVGSFSEGIATVNDESGFYCINKDGQPLFKNKFDYIGNFAQGLAFVLKQKKFSFIDKTGVKAFEGNYDLVVGFSEGLAAVNRGGEHSYWPYLLDKENLTGAGGAHWGYINTTGELVLPMNYSMVSKFKDGIALVEKDGRKYYIDEKGNDLVKKLMIAIKK